MKYVKFNINFPIVYVCIFFIVHEIDIYYNQL